MDLRRYEDMVQSALLSVVRDVLRGVASRGIEKDHRMYIAFRTDFKSVRISNALREKYPKEMMIAIEYGSFRDLRITEKSIFVTLSFGGIGEAIEIPFTAVVAFADPDVRFGLQFEPVDVNDDGNDRDDGEKLVSFDKLKK